MEITELVTYAEETYRIREERKWEGFPGFSVMVHPRTGKWVALLMRQWDGERGEEIQRADIKCGRRVLQGLDRPYLSAPFRMKGANWVGVSFGDATEPEVVCALLDCALGQGGAAAHAGGVATLVLGSEPVAPAGAKTYGDTSLPFAGPAAARPAGQVRFVHGSTGGLSDALEEMRQPARQARPSRREQLLHGGAHQSLEASGSTRRAGGQAQLAFDIAEEPPEVPEKIRQMISLYEYGDGSPAHRARNFYRQGSFMADYVDDAPWQGRFFRYFTTYHDLNVVQLRGYFTWRTRARMGDFRPIATSLAYVYAYELLNGIGAQGPEDALAKLEQFEAGFAASGVGDAAMTKNLRRWMFEHAVVHGLSTQVASRFADAAQRARDEALSILKAPEQHADDEVFSALCAFSDKQLAATPVVAKHGDKGKRLFAEAWRRAQGEGRGKGMFTACFGRPCTHPWHPLANAVVWEATPHPDAYYELNACRSYSCRCGSWQKTCYEQLHFDLYRFRAFTHEVERQFRRALKVGRNLREKPSEAWAAPYALAALETLRREEREAARPVVRIDFSNLARIRADAAVTRDSLLVEEGEPASLDVPVAPAAAPAEAVQDAAVPDPQPPVSAVLDPSGTRGSCAALDAVHERILALLLAGGDIGDVMRDGHLMPSIVADAINEALFDDVGDNVLECDGVTITLVEDYREDVSNLLEASG